MKGALRNLVVVFVLLLSYFNSSAQKSSAKQPLIDVGVASVDITPRGPIRLSGYLRWDRRINESDGVIQHLWAKAIAFGNDKQGPSIIITTDLAGIQYQMVKEVEDYLVKEKGFPRGHLAINCSHTHSGPDMGNSHSMYFNPTLPVDQLGRIALYLDSLVIKLKAVAIEALNNRQPSLVSWGMGSAGFALNRRVIKDGKWVGHGKVPDGPVDHAMPMMKITDPSGKLKAIFLEYACHGTTLVANINKTHGDWIGEAAKQIQEDHPGVTALVAQGCGGDSDPDERGTLEEEKESLAVVAKHGRTIANEVNRLLETQLETLDGPPTVRYKVVQLPFDHVPDTKEFIELSKDKGAKGHNAEVYLDRIVRGIPIDSTMPYYMSSWTFGNKLTVLFLADEVLADYAVRLKKELGADRLWINAYTNDVKAYIPSVKSLKEGGYEGEFNMYYYDHPFRFSDRIEEIIIKGVHDIVPKKTSSK